MTGLARVRSCSRKTARASRPRTTRASSWLNNCKRRAGSPEPSRDTDAFQSCVNLIANSTATAELTGEHSEALQPRLGAIARQMVDQGQSAFELVVGLGGRLDLLPVEITNVVGQADEDSWVYTITRSGPVSTVSTGREQSGRAEFPGSC